MKLRKIITRMLYMCPEAWYITIRTVQLTAFLLLCAFALLVEWNGSLSEHYSLYMTAISLVEITQALLLAAVILSVCIEDVKS